jgi:hypothetical protein
MELEYAFLADAAQVSDGKTFVLGGGVSILWRDAFPAPLGFAIVCQFTYHRTEADTEHEVRFVIMDADGTAVLPDITGSLRVGQPAAGAPRNVPLVVPLVIVIPAVPVVQQAGEYGVDVLLDGRHVKNLPFAVVSREPL